MPTDEDGLYDAEFPVLCEYPGGFLLYVGGWQADAEEEDITSYEVTLRAKGLSDAVVEVTQVARRAGCRHLMLDRDGPEYEELDSFEW